jgi:hypothetical protein
MRVPPKAVSRSVERNQPLPDNVEKPIHDTHSTSNVSEVRTAAVAKNSGGDENKVAIWRRKSQ